MILPYSHGTPPPVLQDVLDLIEGRMGILDLLDETCRFPKVPACPLLPGAVLHA